METTKDKVFGKMTYRHSWSKQDSILMFGKAYSIKITAQAYKNEDINDLQRESYSVYRDFLESHQEEIEQRLLKYCQENYQSGETLETILTPTEILFEQDGSWGVLFESAYDSEHGLAAFIKNDEIIIASQDNFL